MAKCTHVLWTHKLAIHNRAWQQIKQIPYSKQLFNVSTIHSNYCLQSVTSLINGLVDDLLVKTLLAGAHSVFKIVQVGNWNAIHALLQSSADSIVDRIYVRAIGCPYRRFEEIRHGTLQKLGSWLRSMRRRAVLLKHEMIVFVGLMTNVRKKTSLQQSFAVVTCFLDDLKDRVLYCCHALLCIASLCVLRTCVHFPIVYLALP